LTGGRPCRAQVLDQFEGLQLGPAAPGQPDPSADPAYLPRPAGPEAEPAARPPPPYHKGNCDPRFIRLTTNAVPAQQARGSLACGLPRPPSARELHVHCVSTIRHTAGCSAERLGPGAT